MLLRIERPSKNRASSRRGNGLSGSDSLLLLSADFVVLELVVFAGRLPCAPGDLEREFDGELDAVRLPGMTSDRRHEGVVVVGPDVVAAVAAECLASEHVAADTPAVQLEAC